VEDGGLDDILARRAAERDAADAAAVREQADLARAIDDALREQDERCAKAVPAFLEAVRQVPPTYAVTRSTEGPRRLFGRRGVTSFEQVPDGHLVVHREGRESEDVSSERKVVVRLSGQVVLLERDFGPPYSKDEVPPPLALAAYQPPRATVRCVGNKMGTWDLRRSWTRLEDAPPGVLPFYRNHGRAPIRWGDELRALRALGWVGMSPKLAAELVAVTTDWFLERLAEYIEQHA
jgi:hypothetical protein